VWSLNPSGPDVAYLDALIDEVEGRACIDTNRVYLTGFSMGGMMSMVMACREPDRFAAVAPVAGAIEVTPCERDEGVPLLAFHGTADNAVYFDGSFDPDVGLLVGRTEGPSRTEIVEAWSRANDCDTGTDASDIGDDVEHLTFTCPAGEEVEMYVIEDGGHTWPGGEQSPMAEALAGRTTQTIDATRLIWDFFRGHSLEG
jgi:polyhydroxybutyrate depolymerase